MLFLSKMEFSCILKFMNIYTLKEIVSQVYVLKRIVLDNGNQLRSKYIQILFILYFSLIIRSSEVLLNL